MGNSILNIESLSPADREVVFRNNTPKSERVTVAQAAKELGMSQQGVREHMKRNLFKVPIGYVTKTSSFYSYHIYRRMLDKHLGKEDA